MNDFALKPYGLTATLICPLTEKACEWVSAEVVVLDHMREKEGFVIENRFVESLVNTAAADGLSIATN